jgi:uridine kinase
MIGDIITIRPEYYQTAEAIWERFARLLEGSEPRRLALAVGGESGSGKSVTAMCLQKTAFEHGVPALVLHQDDYFRKPPFQNHQQRKADLTWVGPGEVRLDLLQAHVDQFLSGAGPLVKPLINYRTDEILQETLPVQEQRLLLVEGTYALMLERLTVRVFIARTYRDTQQQRADRNRDRDGDFLEQVLAREHALIAPLRERAHLIINPDYRLSAGPIAMP